VNQPAGDVQRQPENEPNHCQNNRKCQEHVSPPRSCAQRATPVSAVQQLTPA
jgi:hypothetical protein